MRGTTELLLVEGPPGTGKTTYLAGRCKATVAERGPRSVAIASLTRAAAAEIGGRDTGIPEDMVGTLHAHAYRALDRPELAETPERLREWNAAHPAFELGGGRRLEDAPDADAGQAPGDELHAAVMNHRARLTPREQWTDPQREHDQRWTDFKRQTQSLDFTDLIEQAITESPIHPALPDVLLLDEAQDFSALELRLAMTWAQRCRKAVIVGDPRQCQPPGTMVLTRDGEVPIEDLDPERHHVIAWNRHESKAYGFGKRLKVEKASRSYVGRLIGLSSEGRQTWMTPDHIQLARWAQDARHCCVYLMRQGDRYRVGWCQVFEGRDGGGLHLATRARIERADAAWILRVFDDRQTAAQYESIVAARYGLPTACFTERAGYPQAHLDGIWVALDADEQAGRAAEALADHGRSAQWPLYDREERFAKRGKRTPLTVRACNLLPELMRVPVYDVERRRIDWQPFTIDERHYSGLVYSLDVERSHTYVADGIVTHNCLYGWRGSSANALYSIPGARHELLRQSHRVPRAVHALAQSWAGQLEIGAAPYEPTDEDGQTRQLEASLRDPATIVDHVAQDLDDGADAMLLASCSYMLAPLVAELRRRAIPFHNPYRLAHGAWNPMRGARRLLAFLRPDERVWGDQARLWTWDDLRAWTEPLKAQGVLRRGAKQLIAEKCRPDRFGESKAGQAVPVETLCELLGVRDTSAHPAFRGDVAWWQEHLLASKASAARYPVEVCRRHGGRALLDEPRVVVGTIHSVKGGQARRVYIAPDLSKQGYWHGLRAGGEPREGVLRMAYVALTRAQETVSLLRPSVPEHLDLNLDRRMSLAA